MVVNEANINNIMGGIESTGGVRLHNHRRKLKQRFDIIKKLGQGTYGKVQLGINKETGQEVAIKTIKKCKIETEADLIRIRREIQIMSSVQHPNIIHIYEVFENREKMVLVMEYAAGGELYDYLSERKVLGEEEARRIFRQIAIAVYYCHKHKICHRDLKLENILLDENGNAKIADFGLSNVFDGQRLLSTFCGSPLYASPEIVKGTPYHGPEVDCWSLGVLLYTLVYGAMPFDGSNFKRLVKQISQGDYFEPKTPSPASSLIRDMLTVTPSKRADMEKICSHWWVNEGYDASCLDIAEHLANQTPVRLDLLLSLAPPPQVGSDKMVITSEENASETNGEEVLAPTRSMSTGSIVDRGTPQCKLRDTIVDSSIIESDKQSPKRKLEMTVSADMANQSGVKRKERSRKKDRDSSSERRSGHRSSSRSKHTKSMSTEDSNIKETKAENLVNSDPLLSEQTTNLKSLETDKSKFVDLENEIIPEGAMCAELVEEANRKNSAIKRKSIKVKKTKTDSIINKTSDSNENEIPVHDKNTNSEIVNKENQNVSNDLKNDAPIAKKIIKKKILADKNQIDSNTVCESNVEAPSVGNNIKEVPELHLDKKQNNVSGENSVEKKMDSDENKNEEARTPTKQIERRRSKIFETAEKFQNLLSSTENKTGASEKPKKIFIPGVNVGGFKQAFERKASLVSSIPPALKNTSSKKNLNTDSKQTIVNHEEIPKDSNQISNIATPTEKSFNDKSRKSIESEVVEVKKIEVQQTHSGNSSPAAMPEDEERKLKLKNAVNIISNALDREGTRKSKSRPCVRKPPVPFGASGRSASGGIDNLISSPTLNGSDSKKILKVQVGPNPTDIKTASVHVSTPEQIKYFIPEQDIENKTLLDDGTKVSTVEVNLKSATLPRRKTTKAEITLNYPQPKPASMEFKTEMQHRVEGHPKLTTQRSEVSFPVSAPQKIGFRSTSLEPESKLKPKERIIPISFEQETVENITIQSPPTKPPTPRLFQTQRSVSQTQRVNSMSRQSTQDSDTESTVSGQPEPIKKSPREYIIPIAVEGGGYVTPRAGSLEPSETSSTATSKSSRMPRFGRTRHMSSLLSDKDGSEDESPFATLHRHSSIGRDSDNEDAHRDAFHLHRLRSSRPSRKVTLEHTDSLSSGEEDDDEGFELLTAENLFSTLLSRVRSLTQRLNVEDSGRPGFPNSRLLSHFGHDNFWNFPNRNDSGRHLPFGRTFSREQDSSSSSIANSSHTPWRRSVSRELASDLEKAFGESQTLPRGKINEHTNFDLSDLNLKNLNLSDEDTVALSYLTPGLSRRIQKQLLAQLPLSQARKLSRTLSVETPNEHHQKYQTDKITRKIDRRSSEGHLNSISQNDIQDSINCENIRTDTTNNSNKNLLCNMDYHDLQGYKPIIKDVNNINHCDMQSNNSSTHSLYSLPLESDRMRFKSSSTSRFSSAVENSDCEFNPKYCSKTLIHNSDLTESDRRLLENYRKSKENKRALRSVSVLESNRDLCYKPPIPYKLSNYEPLHKSDFKLESTTSDRSVLGKYLTGAQGTYDFDNNYSDNIRNYNSALYDKKEKSKMVDAKPLATRRISRFLRPDFYDTPADESIYVKEKKERELETQKVLKEIRDKRLRRRVNIKESLKSDPLIKNSLIAQKNDLHINGSNDSRVDTKQLELSKNIIESEANNEIDVSTTKSKIARFIRPKSFPEKRESPKKFEKNDEFKAFVTNDGNELHEKISLKKSPDKETKNKNNKLKKNSLTKSKAPLEVCEDVNEISSVEKISNKNKFLQSLEKKFEKLRAFSNSISESSNDDSEGISRVTNTIRRLREQSLPRTTEPITESGLIKRAVSVEDLMTLNTVGKDQSKVSRRSVTKILGLFKKYEDKNTNKNRKTDKIVKSKKLIENQEQQPDTDLKEDKNLQKISKESNLNITISDASANLKSNKEKILKSTKIPSKSDSKKENTDNLISKILKTDNSKSQQITEKSNKSESKHSDKNKNLSLKVEKNIQKQQIENIVKPTLKVEIVSDVKIDQPLLSNVEVNENSEHISVVMESKQNLGSKLPLVSKQILGSKSKENDCKSQELQHCSNSTSDVSQNKEINNIDNNIITRQNAKDNLKLNLKHSPSNLASNIIDENLSKIDLTTNKTESLTKSTNKKNLNSSNIFDDSLEINSEVKKLNCNNSCISTDLLEKHENGNSDLLSPCDDSELSFDNWSVCSDYSTSENRLSDFNNPVSLCVLSGDENESVIDRIKRKSFYSRFNEKKNRRKSTLTLSNTNADYDISRSSSRRLYRGERSPKINLEPLSPLVFRSLNKNNGDYKGQSSKEEIKHLVYDKPLYSHSHSDQLKKYDIKNYSRSSSLCNDTVYNKPLTSGVYNTYTPKLHRNSLHSNSVEENNTRTEPSLSGAGDEVSIAGVSTRCQSRMNRTSPSSILNNNVNTDHTSEIVNNNNEITSMK